MNRSAHVHKLQVELYKHRQNSVPSILLTPQFPIRKYSGLTRRIAVLQEGRVRLLCRSVVTIS